MVAKIDTQKYTNVLIRESSPYLLQHAHNPVNWHPWSQEAFEFAKKEDKPIFLSIGYSTCHWCHVMEGESFSDERIARIMNEHFVSIKVDREQRPDIDAVYMNAVQIMTGSGGWPLSVFLTPQGKPFYAGTYFPPKDILGQPGFDRVLLAIAEAWENRRKELLDSATKITAMLITLDKTEEEKNLHTDLLKKAYAHFETIFDPVYGGFGYAPKFPEPNNLLMLLYYWYISDDQNALSMVETTLAAMAGGGIYDHIGGGFHRYSTDRQWFVPHFEKMLYDQALLSKIYILAHKATGKEIYAKIAREIFDYILRDMSDSKGGFYSAEDADIEGKEGEYYVWDIGQIESVLDQDNAKIFNEYYGVTEEGNFQERKNILHVSSSAEKLSKKFKKDSSQIEASLLTSRSKLLEERLKRTRPHCDSKIIAGWNGLMISSFALGGSTLGEDKYLIAAEKATLFVLSNLRQDGRLMRYYRDGRVVEKGFLDDYAFLIAGLLDLYDATFNVKWIGQAKRLAYKMIELFGDETNGGFFHIGKDAEQLIVRHKPGSDGSIPSGNSVAAYVLLRLGRLTTEKEFTENGKKILEAFSERLSEFPASFTAMLAAIYFLLAPPQEIIITGNHKAEDTKEMLKLVHGYFLPNAVTLFCPAGEAGEAIKKSIPFLQGRLVSESKATAFICENYACKKPITRIPEFESELERIAKQHR